MVFVSLYFEWVVTGIPHLLGVLSLSYNVKPSITRSHTPQSSLDALTSGICYVGVSALSCPVFFLEMYLILKDSCFMQTFLPKYIIISLIASLHRFSVF